MATAASTNFEPPATGQGASGSGGNPLVLPPPSAPFEPPAVVRVCALRAVHYSDYRYARSARHLLTHLRLIPPPQHGWQTRLSEDIQIAPLPHALPRHTDNFGNEVVEARHEQVERHLTIVIETEVTTRCAYTAAGRSLPLAAPLALSEQREDYLSFTRRTVPGDALEVSARSFEEEAPDPVLDPFGFAISLTRFVNTEMTFMSGATGIGTTADEAWQARQGVCQDYAHIALSLCRLCGVPARYVSGFVPGEGVMHAWVEMLLTPPGGDPSWWAIDPTYNKWVNERYVTVAVGREYGDITPTSGTYFGGASELHHRTKVVITAEENRPFPSSDG